MPIVLNSVSASPLQGKNPAIQEISCKIQDGQVTLIVGKIGSGKTSLLQTICGLMPLSHGSIYFDELCLWNNNKVNKKILLSLGVVFQNPEYQLFAQTVEGEFRYSLKPYRLTAVEEERRIQHAMTRVGL